MYKTKQLIQGKLLIQLSFAFLIGTIASTPAVCQQPPTFQASDQAAQTLAPVQAHQPGLNPVIAKLMEMAKDETINLTMINKATKTVLRPLINSQDAEGKTLAHYLASSKPEILYRLLDEYNTPQQKSINIQIQDKAGKTPFDYLTTISAETLIHTIKFGNSAMLNRLKRHVVQLFSNEVSPFYWAVMYNNSDMLKTLFDSIASLEVKDIILNRKKYLDETLLHRAARVNNVEAIKFLLEKGVDPNITTSIGTPLHSSVSESSINLEAAKILIEAIPPYQRLAYITTTDSSGKTARQINGDKAESTKKWFRIQAFDDLVQKLISSHATRPQNQPFTSTRTTNSTSYNAQPTVQNTSQTPPQTNPAQALGDTLFQTAKGGKTQDVLALIEQGADVNARNNFNQTPLHLAALHGHTETARALIDNKADLNARNCWGSTPLHLAAEHVKNTETTVALIEQKADVNSKNDLNQTPLHLAISKGLEETTLALIEKNADVNARDFENSTPLNRATECGHTETARALIEKKADVNARDNYGGTPLYNAAGEKGSTEIALALIQKGADVNARNRDNKTPLHAAASKKDTKILFALIEKKADVNAKNNYGGTPLHLAAGYVKNTETTVALIEQKADVNAKNDLKKTPLHLAASQGLKETTLALIEKNADVNARDFENSTPLHHATEYGHTETARALIEKKADVNARDNYGRTPLYNAAGEKGSTEIALALIQKGADVNSKTNRGTTPLHGAASQKDTKILFALMENGADVNASDKYSETPLHLAATKGLTEIALALIEKGADVNAKSNLSHTPLDLARIYKEWHTVDAVSNKIKEIAQHPTPPQPALYIYKAAAQNDLTDVNTLIKEGADVFKSGPSKNTPLHYAAHHGNEEINKLKSPSAISNTLPGSGSLPLEKPIPFQEASQKQQQPQEESRGTKRTREEEKLPLLPEKKEITPLHVASKPTPIPQPTHNISKEIPQDDLDAADALMMLRSATASSNALPGSESIPLEKPVLFQKIEQQQQEEQEETHPAKKIREK